MAYTIEALEKRSQPKQHKKNQNAPEVQSIKQLTSQREATKFSRRWRETRDGEEGFGAEKKKEEALIEEGFGGERSEMVRRWK